MAERFPQVRIAPSPRRYRQWDGGRQSGGYVVLTPGVAGALQQDTQSVISWQAGTADDTIPANTPALLWQGSLAATTLANIQVFDSRATRLVFFTVVGSGVLLAVPEARWDAVVAAADVGRLEYLPQAGLRRAQGRLPTGPPPFVPYCIFTQLSYFALAQYGAPGRLTFGTSTNPVLTYQGNDLAVSGGVYSPAPLPGSGFSMLLSRERLALRSDKSCLATSLDGSLWYMASADSGGPGTRVVFPRLGDPAGTDPQYSLGVCRADGKWWVLLEESNCVSCAAYVDPDKFTLVSGNVHIASGTQARWWDGTTRTPATTSIAPVLDGSNQTVITLDKTGTYHSVAGTVAPIDGTVALVCLTVAGGVLTMQRVFGNQQQRTTTDGIVGTPTAFRRSVAILSSSSAAPTSAGDWTVEELLCDTYTSQLSEDLFLGIGAGGTVLHYAFNSQGGRVVCSDPLATYSAGTTTWSVYATSGQVHGNTALINNQTAKTPGPQFGLVQFHRSHAGGLLPATGSATLALRMAYDSNTSVPFWVRDSLGLLAYATSSAVPVGEIPLYDVSIINTGTPSDSGLVSNHDFESGDLTGWTTGGTITPVIDSGVHHAGSYSARLGSLVGSGLRTPTVTNDPPSGTCTGDGTCLLSLVGVDNGDGTVTLTATTNIDVAIHGWYIQIVDPENFYLAQDYSGTSSVVTIPNPFSDLTTVYVAYLGPVPGTTELPFVAHSNKVTVSWAGTAQPTGDSTLKQTIAIPLTDPAYLLSFSFYLRQTPNARYNYWSCQVWDGGGALLAELINDHAFPTGHPTWYTVTNLDLSRFRGTSIQLVFLVHQEGRDALTAVNFDDITIEAEPAGIASFTPYPAGAWYYRRAGNIPTPIIEDWYGQFSTYIGLIGVIDQLFTDVSFSGSDTAAAVFLYNDGTASLPIFATPGARYSNGTVVDACGDWDRRMPLMAVCTDGAGGLFALCTADTYQNYSGNIYTYPLGAIGEVFHRAGDVSVPWVPLTSGYGNGWGSSGETPRDWGFPMGLFLNGTNLLVVWGDFGNYPAVFLDVIDSVTGAITYGGPIQPYTTAQSFNNIVNAGAESFASYTDDSSTFAWAEALQAGDVLGIPGRVWVTDYAGNSISVFRFDGSSACGLALAGLDGPLGSALVSDQVWIVNAGGETVKRFNQDGSSAGADLTGNGLDVPSGPGLLRCVNLAVVGTKVWVINEDNGSISIFNFDGSVGSVAGFSSGATLTDGYGFFDLAVVGSLVWVTNIVDGLHPLRIFDFTGVETSLPLLDTSTLDQAQCVAVVGTQVWVTNLGNNSITRLNFDGSSAGPVLTGNGLYFPEGIAVVGTQVWVLSSVGIVYDPTISRFNFDGSSAGRVLRGNGLDNPASLVVLPEPTPTPPPPLPPIAPHPGPNWSGSVCTTDHELRCLLSVTCTTSGSTATVQAHVDSDVGPTFWYILLLDELNNIVAHIAAGTAVTALITNTHPVTHTYRGCLSTSPTSISGDAVFSGTLTIVWF